MFDLIRAPCPLCPPCQVRLVSEEFLVGMVPISARHSTVPHISRYIQILQGGPQGENNVSESSRLYRNLDSNQGEAFDWLGGFARGRRYFGERYTLRNTFIIFIWQPLITSSICSFQVKASQLHFQEMLFAFRAGFWTATHL